MTAFRKPRLTCPHCGSVFVIEKPGDGSKVETSDALEEQVEQPKLIEIRSQDWFENFWAYYLFDNLDLCRRMIALAVTTKCWPFDPAKASPNLQAVRGTMNDSKIDISGEAWSAWRKHLDGQGLRFDLNMLPAWVWVPSEWPNEMKRAG